MLKYDNVKYDNVKYVDTKYDNVKYDNVLKHFALAMPPCQEQRIEYNFHVGTAEWLLSRAIFDRNGCAYDHRRHAE